MTAVPIGSLVKNVALEVQLTGLQRNALRMWLALQVLRLVAFVAGGHIGVQISLKPAAPAE